MGCQAGYVPPSTSLTYPHQLIGSPNWKLTLPIGPSENPTEIEWPALQTYSINPYFMLNRYKNAVLFRAHCGGTTTSGSDYPRSELREMENNGADEAEWDMSSGTHTMLLDQVITKVPPNQSEVVVGQIHGGGDDHLRILYNEGALGVSWDDGNEFDVLDPAHTIGLRHKIYIRASSGGVVVKYGVPGRATVTSPTIPAANGCYFKAGMYTISNPTYDSPTAYGEAGLYSVDVKHF